MAFAGFVSPWSQQVKRQAAGPSFAKKGEPFDASLLVDDEGNKVSFAGNGLSARLAGEDIIRKRRETLREKDREFTFRTGMPKNSAGLGLNEWDGFKGLMALKENAAAVQGRGFQARGQDPARHNGPLRDPIATPADAWSRGGPTDGTAWSQGGGSRGAAMPVAQRTAQRTVVQPQGAVYDDVDQAAQTGSGAAVALARKRQELGLAALESALMRQRLADQDPDGSQAANVALGRERQSREWDESIGAPRAQAAQNAVGALAGAAKRDEWQKNWDTEAPKRQFEGEQYERRYVMPADIRSNAGLDVANVNADARRDVAETTGASRVDSAQMQALARLLAEMQKSGQGGEARAYAETADVLPPSTITQRLDRLRQERPGLTPDNYINLLGEITDDEYDEAFRYLGGA